MTKRTATWVALAAGILGVIGGLMPIIGGSPQGWIAIVCGVGIVALVIVEGRGPAPSLDRNCGVWERPRVRLSPRDHSLGLQLSPLDQPVADQAIRRAGGSWPPPERQGKGTAI